MKWRKNASKKDAGQGAADASSVEGESAKSTMSEEKESNAV